MVDVEEKVKDAIVVGWGIERGAILLESSLVDDFGRDSLDIIDVVMWLETDLGIELNLDKMEKAVTVKDIVDIVKVVVGE